jgi:phage shock protein C
MNDSAPLHRAASGRMVAGVAAGLASYLKVDVTIVRIGFVLAAVLGGGIGIPAYLACLLLIPEEGASQSIASSMVDSVQGRR